MLVSFFMVLTLAGVKFLLYYLSGSLVVYAEAWHSLSDVLTSLVVLGVLVFSNDTDQTSRNAPSGGLRQWIRAFVKSPEHLASLFIGVLLFAVSLGVLRVALFSPPPRIERPLTVGLVFLVLSVGSYFIYRFQARSSEETGSLALNADSQHNRADSLVSAFTGLSLLVQAAGLSVDRWSAVILSGLLLSMSASLVYGAFRSIAGHQDAVGEYEALMAILRGGAGLAVAAGRRALGLVPPGFGRSVLSWTGRLTAGAAVLWYLSTCVFRVMPDEEAYVLFLGEPTSRQALGPGAHLKPPWPFARVVTVKPHRVRTVYLGNSPNDAAARAVSLSRKKNSSKKSSKSNKLRSKTSRSSLRFASLLKKSGGVATGRQPSGYEASKSQTSSRKKVSGLQHRSLIPGMGGGARLWSRWHGDTPYLITGDGNVLYVYTRVEYVISDSYKYLFSHADPDGTIRREAYGALVQAIASTTLYGVLLSGRRIMEQNIRKILTQRLSAIDAGVKIVSVYIVDVHPPAEIARAFEEVIAAYQLQEKSRLEAESHMIQVLSGARLKAERTVARAESSARSRILEAQGTASRFLQQLQAFESASGAVSFLMHLERAESILKRKKLVLVDPQARLPAAVLYMESFRKGVRK